MLLPYISPMGDYYIWLVVWTPLKNIKVNRTDYPIYPIYEMENKIHVWNHQPDIIWVSYLDIF
jgi:hypothetical protein